MQDLGLRPFEKRGKGHFPSCMYAQSFLQAARRARRLGRRLHPVERLLHREAGTQLNTLKNRHENPHEPKFEKETCTNFLSHEFFSIRF